ERHGQTEDVPTMSWIACICKLGPEAVPDPARLVPLIDKALTADAKYSLYLSHRAGLLYRAGPYQEAVAQLNECMRLPGRGGNAFDWVWLALAHHRLGQADEARRWLD